MGPFTGVGTWLLDQKTSDRSGSTTSAKDAIDALTFTAQIVPEDEISYVYRVDAQGEYVLDNDSKKILDAVSSTELLKISGTTVTGVNSSYLAKQIAIVNVPEGITSIGAFAFDTNYTAMTEINLPDSLITIANCSFRSCTALENLVIPANVTTLIQWGSFYNCTALKTVTVKGDSLTSICEAAFANCTALTTLTFESRNITDKTIVFGKECFKGDTALTTVQLPIRPTEFAQGVFASCSSISMLTLAPGTKLKGAWSMQQTYYFTVSPDFSNESGRGLTDCISTIKTFRVVGEASEVQNYKSASQGFSDLYDRAVNQVGANNIQFVSFYTAYGVCDTHKFGEVSVTSASTCTVKGTGTQTCSECGLVENVELPLLPHTMADGGVNTASTCTVQGKQKFTCSVCGYEADELLPLADHAYVETSRNNATCTGTGTIYYNCSVCNAPKQETIPATGHAYVYNYVFPTVKTAGNKHKSCKNCDDISEDTPVPVAMSVIYTVDGSGNLLQDADDNYIFDFVTFSATTSYSPNIRSQLYIVNVPEGTTAVGGYRGSARLKKVELASTVTTLAKEAFYQCTALEEINQVYGLTSIEQGAIGQTKIYTLVLSSKATFIDRWSIQNVTELTVGTSVKTNNHDINNTFGGGLKKLHIILKEGDDIATLRANNQDLDGLINKVIANKGTVDYTTDCKVFFSDAHDDVAKDGLTPNCTTAGYTAYTECSRCKLVTGKTELPASSHNYTGTITVVYANGLNNAGLQQVQCRNCVATQDTELSAVITIEGYSTCEIADNGQILVGYSINQTALALYNEYNNEFTFGVLVGYGDETVGTNFASVLDGNENEKVFGLEIDTSYNRVNVIVDEISASNQNIPLVIVAFTKEGTNAPAYYQNATGDLIGETGFRKVTYAGLKGAKV